MQNESIPIRTSRLAPLLQPAQAFLSAEAAGGIVLMIFAVAALVWVNSPWGDSYHSFWNAKLSVSFAGHALAMSLEHWVNDGLMVIFFLLVGLEIKRELLIGELATLRRAALPIAAAVGGMAVPALLYFAVNAGGPGAAGWGVPMATDIAFAVGVLALVSRAIPTSVKVFLLAIAIVDDLGAVLVIAFFYTSQISGAALAIVGAFLAGLVALNILRVHRPLPYLILGVGLWAATLASGIHSWIAVKSGLASLPTGATVRQIVGVSVLCGIGFTMSLFVANLAFPNLAGQLTAAKVGILAASLAAGIIGAGVIAWAGAWGRSSN
jgi:Na+:H+ antiporter, NhaA family